MSAGGTEESDSGGLTASPGRCNFQNHLQPKHCGSGSTPEMFWETRGATGRGGGGGATSMQLQKRAHEYTPPTYHQLNVSMKNSHWQLSQSTGGVIRVHFFLVYFFLCVFFK